MPLAPLERDALKERLRATLKLTKDSLLATTRFSTLPDGWVDETAVPWERTLVLSDQTRRQFMHLENNGTGSEDVDRLMACALDRQNDWHEGTIEYRGIREGNNARTCLRELAERSGATFSDEDNRLHGNGTAGEPAAESAAGPGDAAFEVPGYIQSPCGVAESNVMSYSTSLSNVATFGWQDVDSIAMFGNPVERLYRVYQRTAQECYDCRELAEVLRRIKSGNFSNGDMRAHSTAYSPYDSCAAQMIGHQATNLLSSIELFNVANDVSFPMEREIVEEAVSNLREGITWIGLLDEMEESVAGFREIFPWLAVSLNAEVVLLAEEFAKNGNPIGDDANFALPEDHMDKNSCTFDQREEKVTCGSKEVDEEALQLIEELNMRDLAVYKAAVEVFAIQKEVLEEYHQHSP